MEYHHHYHHDQYPVRARRVVAQVNPLPLYGLKSGELLIHKLHIVELGRNMTDLITVQVKPGQMPTNLRIHPDEGNVVVDSVKRKEVSPLT